MSLLKKTGMWIVVLALTLSGLTFATQANAATKTQDVTRGEYISAIVKALEFKLSDGETLEFTDVDAKLAPYVEAAQKMGLIKGASSTTFKPNQKLTREHAFLIASRAIKSEEIFSTDLLDKFKDKSSFKTDELVELSRSVGLGLLQGFEDGTAKPQKIVTKVQVAKIIDRLLSAYKVEPPTNSVSLRILGTSDLHTNFVNYDYYQDKASNEVGLAKTAVLIEQARAENPNNLLFDNGDLIQGTPLGGYKVTVDKLEKGELHPALAALESLNFDASTLGNHEFNYGLDYLDLVLEEASFPVLNANVYDAKTKNNRYTPYAIFDKEVVDGLGEAHTLKVGVIGVVAPGIVRWDRALLDGKVTVEDAANTVEKFIPEMKGQGADIIVVLSHSGMGDEIHTVDEDDVTYQISQLDGVDAILTGHNHAVFPGDFGDLKNIDMEQGTVNGTPVVMPGKFGSHLGIIDLELKKSGDQWAVIKGKGAVREIDKKSDKVVQKVIDAVKEAHEGTIKYVRSPVGKTTAPINSYFSLVKDDPSIQLVTNAQKWFVEDKIKGTKYEKLPVLSSGAPFKAGGRNGANYYTEIPTGEIAIKNVADLYVFDNTLFALVMTGADVKEWLEMSAGQFNQIDPSSKENQNLINEEFRTYNFDVIDGVTYEFDVTQPAKYDYAGKTINDSSNRVVNLKYDGKPIDPKQEFIVVTNNYRASGDFPGVRSATDSIDYAYENRQVIMDYMIDVGTIDPSADSNWAFAPLNESINVTFETSSKAKEFIQEGKGIEYLSLTKDGFAEFSLKQQ
ncbi:bifunctional 2',3'-cyclic-nucleotide 2'-phosphodiesterase/3'-nucleotidase [Sporosarcina sp. ANT_H38]|uniref:bifunctional 2',3'-cyclic-nucleotide 2'-phosphodiesterase/3'-nucleotidase n=1 Tax=Sporosarcina sp. ANT_H38 TaxID=2597358 RepID=UPI00210478E3|nr:bifunctional 2',3'-cyclic-nucleotide 2'-phosphodiesterase/3'-nucleotidase [Sporosarcina sp. ANT_H38]